MKKLSFLFVAIAFVGLVTISCKPAAAPAESTEATEAVQEAAPVVDSAAAMADTTAAVVEE
jgi:hypothetical protein